ncbi:SDR family oxidoreductase [Mesoflavibacter zeaxanthinifaciens]|uniref:SDR family oxidoreductase n=1 Tax=Mesoflavibacter zeaxanthinifaciens TaxID=393060 RepID=UPI0026F16567|nr:SDR family oxidoreductase [Mesoflavibacter zeaxanthinifaciens]
MILVTGATGEYGTHAINSLLEKGVEPSNISALVRSEEKGKALKEKGLNIKIGDYNDYNSLVEAFKGVDKLLFVSGSEIGTREAQHKNVVNAAKEAGVDFIAYTSFIRNVDAKDSAIEFLQDTHQKTEQWIKDSGIDYAILQNGLYLDILPMFLGENVLEDGILLPAEDGKSNSVLRAELAEAAAHVLTTSGHENKTYPLVNNEAVTYQEVANQLSSIKGETVNYTSPKPDTYQTILKENNVPEEYIGMLTSFSVAQAKGELQLENNTLEQFLGRKPKTVKQYLTEVYS